MERDRTNPGSELTPKLLGSVPVMFLREGDTFIVHCPALDLASSGATLEEAQANFREAANLFVEECNERGTLEEVLTSCGWQVQVRDHERSITPPQYLGGRQIPLDVIAPA